jgi:hypothetical protein
MLSWLRIKFDKKKLLSIGLLESYDLDSRFDR